MAHKLGDFIADLYQKTYEKLFRIAYRMLGDTQQAAPVDAAVLVSREEPELPPFEI